MKSKIIPMLGAYAKVLTSLEFKDQIGYVKEVTSSECTLVFKGDRIGKFKLDKNEFIDIRPWFGPDAGSLDERIEILESIEMQLAKKVYNVSS